jgi:hypothetical protein
MAGVAAHHGGACFWGQSMRVCAPVVYTWYCGHLWMHRNACLIARCGGCVRCRDAFASRCSIGRVWRKRSRSISMLMLMELKPWGVHVSSQLLHAHVPLVLPWSLPPSCGDVPVVVGPSREAVGKLPVALFSACFLSTGVSPTRTP